jgi:hypothetical protein
MIPLMSTTFDIRHTEGDILLHLPDESFGPEVRQLLGETVPGHPHGEITRGRIEHLRRYSLSYPLLHMPFHSLGPLCVEILQPSFPISPEALGLMEDLTRALASIEPR